MLWTILPVPQGANRTKFKSKLIKDNINCVQIKFIGRMISRRNHAPENMKIALKVELERRDYCRLFRYARTWCIQSDHPKPRRYLRAQHFVKYHISRERKTIQNMISMIPIRAKVKIELKSLDADSAFWPLLLKILLFLSQAHLLRLS